MSFVEKEWLPYGRRAKFIEVNVKDQDNQTIDFFKLKKENTRDMERMIKKIKEKYDFDLQSEQKETEEIKEKSNWLKKADW